VTPAEWLSGSELRIGLGCMRLSTDAVRDEERAFETIAAAARAGITIFDTAHAYGHGPDDLGHNERLIADALRRCVIEQNARVVTKGGMARTAGRWVPDGRAKTIFSDCEASLVALDGLPIDLYLLHAPDPRTPWRTSLRALTRLVEEGLVRRIGVSNVNRPQLEEALDLAPISAVQVALSVQDDRAVRGGLVERCESAGVILMAHSPLGGPRMMRRLDRQEALSRIAEERGTTPAEVALAWLLQLSPVVVPIPGARRPETAHSAAHAATLPLDDDERAALGRSLGASRPTSVERRRDDAEVVLIMGIPGAGKSRHADGYVTRGYLRLNRDERGGSLRDLAKVLDEELASAPRPVVLDNTYLTRAVRSYVLETALRHTMSARCIWIDTPVAQAQVNLVERLLDRFGTLPTPEEMRALAKRDQGVVAPTSLMRTVRELEPPSVDEGWDDVERVTFVREPQTHAGVAGVFVAAKALGSPASLDAIERAAPEAPHLVFDWDPDGSIASLTAGAERLAMAVTGPVERALCPHAGGPPQCWCRPPLPGLPLAFARAHEIDLSRSTLIGSRPAHRLLADALGVQYIDVDTKE
jgi:aryl-alcohol dehydrogenase-like predicted oxidoreductase/adenylate kinase family enzyme